MNLYLLSYILIFFNIAFAFTCVVTLIRFFNAKYKKSYKIFCLCIILTFLGNVGFISYMLN